MGKNRKAAWQYCVADSFVGSNPVSTQCYLFRINERLVSKETLVSHGRGTETLKFDIKQVISYQNFHREEITKLMFRVLALRFDEGLTLETSPSFSLHGGKLYH